MKRLLIFLIFMLICNCWSQTKVPDWVNRVLFDKNGKEIWEVIVDGRPPENFRMPAVDLETERQRREVYIIDDVPVFDWCYGCANTAAAMWMGYHDRNGYSNMYAGPANAGVCPGTNLTWGWGESPLSATHQGYDGLNVRGHVDDYFVYSGYEGEDPWMTGGWTPHAWADCTGDYMGTSQYSLGASDGATLFYFERDGGRLGDLPDTEDFRDRDGCSGLADFVASRGYYASNYYTSMTGGISYFTFADYMAEIDENRPVMLFVHDESSGHAMLGVGYDSMQNLVYLHDTWDWSVHTMQWNGEYSGMEHYAVMCLQLASNQVTANFTVNDDHGVPPFTVNFNDISSGYPIGWDWDFDNDGTIDSQDEDPAWTYQQSGVYSVSLHVYNWDTEDSVTHTDYIVVNTPPQFDLPASFGFEEGSSLVLDMSNYSWDADGDDYSLAIAGNQDLIIEQNGLELTITAPAGYTGSEILQFTLEDEWDSAQEDCTIMVYPQGGAVVYVPDDHPSIQQAIDNAGHGYTIIVRPGTYEENIVLGNNEIILGSMYLETGNEAYINQTVIYGDGDDVVTITEGEIFQEFCGFKITHSGGGSGMLIQNRPVYIHHLNFHYNMSQKGAGIYIEEGEPLIEYCTFSENFLSGDGGTVYSDNAQPLLYNLTFYNNYADDGSAIMAVNNSDVTAKNLIVWGNEENTLVADETSQLAVTYSNLQEMQAGEGIISTDPLFANPAVYDLALLAGSPCIDSGDPDTDGDGINWETDTGDQEPDGTRRDMGGKFHNQNNPAVNNEIAAAPDVIVFPNPWFVTSSRQNLRISWNLEAAGFAEMDIYNIKGQLLNRQIFAPGALSACWNGRDRNGQPAATGVYFFNLKSENINHTRKFLLVR